ncbi:hypothetical protein HKX48_000706 [Thoreauomyces humboldtii]|nr:hypothetical protein HKX48_000706 [Thoreauomyces humboldtii]
MGEGKARTVCKAKSMNPMYFSTVSYTSPGNPIPRLLQMGKKRKEVATLPPPDSPLWANQSAFRVVERSWKRREVPDELYATLIDPAAAAAAATTPGLELVELQHDPRQLSPHFGEQNSAAPVVAFSVTAVPGLVIIPGLITPSAQARIVHACLNVTKLPNVTNLDTHWVLPTTGLWAAHVAERQGGAPCMLDMRKDGYHESVHSLSQTPQEAVPPPEAVPVRIDPPTTSTHHLKAISASEATKRLRWTSLGYQYNWTDKTYHLDRRPPIPPLIDELATAVVDSVSNLTHYTRERWRSEAGIINFYQPTDRLMAHQDRSEVNTEAPLVSFSFGNSCVFLIGTETRKDEPTSLLLHSGDALVMYGSSRRAFHSVPRILENTIPSSLSPERIDTSGWADCYDFLKHARININVRQVF